MRLKSIYLENIRSYKNQKINFEKGSTLLAGDIGTGKTSILLGIEFGFFGLQPGQKGSALLRNGETHGKVVLEFQVNDLNIIVERNLKRGKTVSQDSCFIEINENKIELSVTELKSKILELLNYPREFSKKQNLLYKFTVYTPQEEMKQIILEDAESRINTLRYIFGIDKYKKVLDNILIIKIRLKEEKKLLEGQTFNLEEDQNILVQKKLGLQELEKNIPPLKLELDLKIKLRKNLEIEKKLIQDNIEEKKKLIQEREKSKLMILSKKDNFLSNSKEIISLKKEIFEFEKLNFDNDKINLLDKEILNLKNQREKTNSEILEINSKLVSFKEKLEEYISLEKKFSNLEKCPTCLQSVDSIYRANILNKNYNQISKVKNEIDILELNKKEVMDILKKINLEIESTQKAVTDLKILKSKSENILERRKRLIQLENSNEYLQQDVSLLTKHISNLNDSILDYSKFDKIYEEKHKELENAFSDEKKSEIKLATTKKEVDFFKNSLIELEQRIEKTKEIKLKLDNLSELENWISKKFIPMISFVESNVMKALKQEFSKVFSEWFSILVGDTLSVRLSDNFTPIIEQKDYELDYSYLSGGERTAVALAYRLSLNQVINSLISNLKTKDLVILDEPTDGFSSSQLDKMRTVLEELDVAQLIIVSHEQKIEGFVENIIRFKKNEGESFIEV